jgi:hypothetical protein
VTAPATAPAAASGLALTTGPGPKGPTLLDAQGNEVILKGLSVFGFNAVYAPVACPGRSMGSLGFHGTKNIHVYAIDSKIRFCMRSKDAHDMCCVGGP